MTMSSATLKLGVFSIFILFCALYYKRTLDYELQQRLKSTLNGLLTIEQKLSIAKKKIAVGYGSCLDLFVDSSLIFNQKPPIEATHHGLISSRKELHEVFAYFFNHGAAGERYTNNLELFSSLVKDASQLKIAKWALGGNAPVMASRFLKEGAEVLLGAQFGQRSKKMILDDMKLSSPSTDQDDIHLIYEYKADQSWGKYQASRANRFIIHSDKNNPLASSAEKFRKDVLKFDPDLLVISGLQMMDNYPFKDGERASRLKIIRDTVTDQNPMLKVHFEMASFSDPELLFDLISYIIPYSNSMGMNEQELPNLHSALLYKNLSLVSTSHPRIASVLDQMRDVFSYLQNVDESIGQKKITRIHVHTLAYQAIMTKKNSGWKNTMSATAKASLIANRHTCGAADVDTLKAKLIMDESFTTSAEENGERIPFNAEQPVSCWTENGDVEICIAPVLVCTQVKQTAGCGDNISSAALLPQL